MKLQLYLLAFLLGGAAWSNNSPDNNPDCCPVMFSTTDFDISFDPEYYKIYFDPIHYDHEGEYLFFNSKKKISFVELSAVNHNNLRLIVMSNSVQLDKDLFNLSDALMVFHFEEDDRKFEIEVDFK